MIEVVNEGQGPAAEKLNVQVGHDIVHTINFWACLTVNADPAMRVRLVEAINLIRAFGEVMAEDGLDVKVADGKHRQAIAAMRSRADSGFNIATLIFESQKPAETQSVEQPKEGGDGAIVQH